MKQSQKRVILIISAIFAAYLLGAVGNISSVIGTVKKPQATLFAVTRHDFTIYDKYETRFKELYPECGDIQWLELADVAAWRSAIQSPNYNIDILWGGGPTFFNVLADEDLILPIQDATLTSYLDDNVPEEMAGAEMSRKEGGEYLWVAAAISSFGFTVNHKNLETYGLEVPRSWEELASPEYFLGTTQHAIGMGDAPETTSNTRIYQIILQKFGWEAGWDILTRMHGNSKIFEAGSGATRDSVVTGEQAVAMTIDFYGYQAQVQNKDCEYILPENETYINADPIAVASSTANRDLTEKFVEFVMSDQGQAMWLDDTINRIPILYDAFEYAETNFDNERPDLESVFLNLNTSAQTIDFSEDIALSIFDAMRFHCHGAYTKSQEYLYDTWGDLVDQYRKGRISEAEFRSLSREMSDPPVTLKEMQQKESDYVADPNLRDKIINDFKSAALERYAAVKEKIVEEVNDFDDKGSYFDEYEVEITSPTEDSTVSGTTTIKANAVEYGDWSFVYGISSMAFYVNDELLENVTSKPFEASWDTTGAASGSHIVRVVAKEYTGRLTTDVIQVNIGTSSSFPLLNITAPADDKVFDNATSISIDVTAEQAGDFQIDSVVIEIVGSSGQALYKKVTTGFSDISVSWDITKSLSGNYTIFAVAFYENGNAQYKSVKILIQRPIEDKKDEAGPGFDFISVTLGIAALLGISIFLNRRKRR
ncbi:MAG: extracellular solute-binding protein [Candidatus Heimdallarchaeota archaeon]|nr:MAG: extracellular solute-binding protein [Candidatus Heimdallarchaeota archaeon]